MFLGVRSFPTFTLLLLLSGCRFGYSSHKSSGDTSSGAHHDMGDATGDTYGDAAIGSTGDGDVDAGGAAGDGDAEATDAGTSERQLDSGSGTSDTDAGNPSADAGSSTDVDAGCTNCTLPVSFGSSDVTASAGGTGGGAYIDSCGTGRALIGYRGYVFKSNTSITWLTRLQAVCGDLTLDTRTDTVLVSNIGTLSEHGSDGDLQWQRVCPQDNVVIAFAGESGAYLDQLQFTCAPLARSGTNIVIGQSTTLAPVGGSNGGVFGPISCPAGEVAVGANGGSGQWVDRIALRCATPSAQ
jgi:hypothetical protein